MFDHQARIWSVPNVLKGVFRMALRVAFQEFFDGTETNSEARVVQGWKFFLLFAQDAVVQAISRSCPTQEVGV